MLHIFFSSTRLESIIDIRKSGMSGFKIARNVADRDKSSTAYCAGWSIISIPKHLKERNIDFVPVK
jgi:hypothetical protein